MIKHVESKNKSAESNFGILKNCIMLNVSLTKTERNNKGVLPSVPQNFPTKINKTNKSWNYFFHYVWL